jgi:tetratricopeptide (TPR) repeat protein
MPEQLSLFGPSEHVLFEPIPEPEAPLPVSPWVPIDPRQCSIFDGPLSHVIALQTACVQLDVPAARAHWGRVASRFPDWAQGEHWPRWIDELERLLQPGASVARTERLVAERTEGSSLFAGLPGELRRELVDELLVRTASELLDAQGARAELPDGKPAGYLCLLAGRLDRALEALTKRIAQYPRDGRSRGYRAEVLWRSGQQREAIEQFRDAYLIDPEAVDEAWISCEAVHELLDQAAELELPGNPAAWVGPLGEMQGVWPQTPASVERPIGTAAWQMAADILLRFRQQQRAGLLSEAERIGFKRALLRCAPQLRDLVRRL